MVTYEMLLLAVFINCILVLPVVQSRQSCCDDGVSLLNRKTCKNNKETRLSCKNNISMLNSETYFNAEDVSGEYLDVWLPGYIVREPDFCFGTMKNSISRPASAVVLVCGKSIIHYSSIYANAKMLGPKSNVNASSSPFFYEILLKILNFLSFLLLAATALLYYLAPAAQDTDGICMFHLAVSMCLLHGLMGYYVLFDEGILPNLCITNLYFLVYALMATVCWDTVMSFNLWKCLRENQKFDKFKLILSFRMFGYGIPALLVFSIFIGALVNSLYTTYQFQTACEVHEQFLLSVFVRFPFAVLLSANIFFFLDAQAKLAKQTFTMPKRGSALRNFLRYRLMLQGKIFVTVCVPWAVLIILFSIPFGNSYSFLYILYILVCAVLLFIFAEGISVFFIAVIGRGRMRKFIARRLFNSSRIVPETWKTEEDSEVSQESECEEIDNTKTDFTKPTNGEIVNTVDLI